MSVFRISGLNILRTGRQPALLVNFSDDASKKDDPSKENDSTDKKGKDEKTANKKREVTSRRINELLGLMTKDTNLSIVKDVIRPRSAAEKKERHKAASSASEQKASKPASIAEAAKEVAKTLGGDIEKTESELLGALLKKQASNLDLNSLISGMTVDTEKRGPPSERRSDFVRKSMTQRSGHSNYERKYERKEGIPRRNEQQSQSGVRVHVDLFGGKPLGIFTTAKDLQESPDILPTWNNLLKKELKLAVSHPPKNYFEKMALWTEQGKLWKFPIDNEQGLDEEAKIYFTEHIFLEQHLESWCPKKGPVRHFMELVCVGLSKNPHYTVTQKKEHIEWYRDYFAAKKELLESVIIDSDTPKELQQ
ncbi:28S ribosomal protein S31, mitochondrial [Bradysia coprophila]|uniref:28S ribosomal protein S31, mitochondrial n=1 Tax=Bradysia coprophila TaxID=38358 RepID=UPI00187DA656|nr:28S ribosomal protein S31, mitochondrial [Bradysia coprophila]